MRKYFIKTLDLKCIPNFKLKIVNCNTCMCIHMSAHPHTNKCMVFQNGISAIKMDHNIKSIPYGQYHIHHHMSCLCITSPSLFHPFCLIFHQSILTKVKWKELIAVVASSNQNSFVDSKDEKDLADNKISKEEHLSSGHNFFFLNKTFSKLLREKVCSRLRVNKLVHRPDSAHHLAL